MSLLNFETFRSKCRLCRKTVNYDELFCKECVDKGLDVQLPKAMISQPMTGKTEQDIVATREKAKSHLENQGYEFVNTLFTDEWYSPKNMQARGVVQIPLCFLAKSLEKMSLCHAAYFCKGWENARGCKAEHDIAKAYGLKIIYEVQECKLFQSFYPCL